MAERLVAWLYGTPVVSLTPESNYRVSLEWDPSGIERWGLGSRVLSISLPLGSPTSSRDDRALDFFSNLLPDGPVLMAMAQLAGVSPLDTYGLLAMFGSECAGAVVLLREGEGLSDASAWSSKKISTQQLGALIADLPTAPFGADLGHGWTPSLAGYQGKLVLGRSLEGQWTRPTNGAPSTWILKPDREYRMAENEATCLALASACGLNVPDVELVDLEGTKILAIRRYDRDERVSPIARVHQEDGCQATGTPPMKKYEHAGGPSLKDLATLLRDYGGVGAMRELLARVTFNVGVGNADAHAKNFSFLHGTDGQSVELAPAYDLLSTIALEKRPNGAGVLVGASTAMGQRVNDRVDILHVANDDLIAEGIRWGLRPRVAEQCVTETLDAMSAGIDQIEGVEVVRTSIRAQLRRVSKRRR